MAAEPKTPTVVEQQLSEKARFLLAAHDRVVRKARHELVQGVPLILRNGAAA